MLEPLWESSWGRLEPALQSVRALVLERHRGLSGYVTRTSYGNVLFAAQLYFMRDPIRDEHELVLLEVQIVSDSDDSTAPAHERVAHSPSAAVLDIWIPETGSIARAERSIPPGAAERDICRIAFSFFDEVLEALPAYTEVILGTLKERLDGGGANRDGGALT